MLLMTFLCAVVAGGLIAIVRWGALDIRLPWADEVSSGRSQPIEMLRRYLWYLTLAVTAGCAAGLVMIGGGGRLAMRLLAATAGDAAQGRVTEAEEIVGQISLDGTLGFIIFIGLLGGLITGTLYVLVARWLPRGRWGGVVFGGLLLILGATRFDPLRPENRDFDIVGPGWLSVAVFIALGLGHGMLVAAIAGRYSRALPLWSKDRRAIAAHAPLALLVPLFPAVLAVVVVAALVIAVSRSEALVRLLASPGALVAGRVVGVGLALVALPGFLAAVIDIAGRP